MTLKITKLGIENLSTLTKKVHNKRLTHLLTSRIWINSVKNCPERFRRNKMIFLRYSKQGNTYERCGYDWIRRSKETPKVCPKCKSLYWDIPREKSD